MEQRIGQGGAGVQIDGDNNTVTLFAGTTRLVLDRRHLAKAPPETERDLLLTERRATDRLAATEAIDKRLFRHLAEAGAKKLGEAGEEKLLAWLRGKGTGAVQVAPAELERAPEVVGKQADLREKLAKLLEQEPGLLAELRAMLPASAGGGDRMEQHVEGAGATGVQFKGSGNTVTR